MAVTNLTSLEKPLQKLVETVSEGVGVVGNHIFEFDVAKIKRIGKAEAEAEKEKIIANAEAQEQAVEILSRAGKRFALEQYNKQINLENILVKSKEDLVGKEVALDPVKKDWTMRFLNAAQDVGREEIQDVLAKILSGEVQSPGRFSYQTILKSSTQQIFLYDENQSVRPSDIPKSRFNELNAQRYTLLSQLRVEGGEEYINYIDDLLSLKKTSYRIKNYDFKIYDDIHAMVSDIKTKDKKHGLARVVAGYAWSWKTKNNSADYDIEIDGLKLVWNSTTANWVNSKNAVNEVGCIHTIQGYDLNYTGVIIGPEIGYDPILKKIFVDRNRYMDTNGWRGVDNPEELERYIINIYKTLLSRGIKGTYVYVSDPDLREYFKASLIT